MWDSWSPRWRPPPSFIRGVLGCRVTVRQEPSGQGIAKMYVTLANLTIELIEPTTAESPIKDLIGDHSANEFLRLHPGGGIHHVCYSVPNLPAACDRLHEQGYAILGSGAAGFSTPGAIVFIDPSTTHGALIELKARM